jgi:hypothetical protein
VISQAPSRRPCRAAAKKRLIEDRADAATSSRTRPAEERRPTVKPAPTAAIITRSPDFTRFSSRAVPIAKGIVAAVVLP